MSLFGDIGSALGSLTGTTQSRAISRGLRDQLASSDQAAGVLNSNYGTAQNTLKSLYDQSQGQLAPLAQQGADAFGNLNSQVNSGKFTNPTFNFDPSNLANTPGYQFQLQQGLGALQNTAAARGGVLGGNALHDATNYAQGLASTTYQNQYNNALQGYNANVAGNQANYNNLYGLAQYGPALAQQQAQLSSQYGTNAANLNVGQGQSLADIYTGQGNAKAAAGVGKANAYSAAGGNLLNIGGKLLSGGISALSA